MLFDGRIFFISYNGFDLSRGNYTPRSRRGVGQTWWTLGVLAYDCTI